MINVIGGGKEDGVSQLSTMQNLLRKSGLSACTSFQTMRIESGVPGKPRSFEDLLVVLPLDKVFASGAPINRIWVLPGSGAHLLSGKDAPNRQDSLCRIDSLDPLERPAILQSMLAYAALAGFLEYLTGAQVALDQPLQNLAPEQVLRWKALWLSTTENLARQVGGGLTQSAVGFPFCVGRPNVGMGLMGVNGYKTMCG
jgi:hypothetical protein